MDLPVLYTFRRCPYAIRARMALLLSKQAFVVREVDLKNMPSEMLKISPKATVPVMVLPDGTVLEESLHIMHWAFERNEVEESRRFRENEILVIEQLISENDGPFVYILDRYKYPDRYKNDENKDWRHEADKFLNKLEMFLTHNAYFFGSNYGLEDLAIMPFVRQFRMVDAKWFDEEAPYPKVKLWLNNWLEHKLFTGIMQKYEPWKNNDKEIVLKA